MFYNIGPCSRPQDVIKSTIQLVTPVDRLELHSGGEIKPKNV
jgi:hypothetical protein